MGDIFENHFLTKELARIICNKRVGIGMSREVWSSGILPDHVIKFEVGSGMFQNQFEWETWTDAQHTKLGKWFAPCDWISPCGSVLIMKKTKQLNKLPGKMPVFFSDFKASNYGMYDGRVVCHDYGTSQVITKGLVSQMQKVSWNDDRM